MRTASMGRNLAVILRFGSLCRHSLLTAFYLVHDLCLVDVDGHVVFKIATSNTHYF